MQIEKYVLDFQPKKNFHNETNIIATVEMPKEAKPLRVERIKGIIYVWMIFDERYPTCEREFLAVFTGNYFPFSFKRKDYLGMTEGELHIFDLGNVTF